MDDLVAKIRRLLPDKIADIFVDETCCDYIFLLRKAETAVSLSDIDLVKEGLLDVQAVLDFAWERLNIGHWKEVPVHLHHLFTSASLLKIILLLQSCNNHNEIGVLREALSVADMGLIVGAPLELESGKGDLRRVANILTLALKEKYQPLNVSSESLEVGDREEELLFKSNGLEWQAVPVEECPSLERFYENYFKPELPVKLTGCIGHWPALRLWRNLDYLVGQAGPRLVPVEVGAHYLDPGWSQDLMTLSEFVTRHVAGREQRVGYLAQHRLLDQVPELRADIYEPEYCSLGREEGDGPDVNAWFGPRGTLSPLHYDPKHNLLCQAVGTKRVLLYSPVDSPRLYPHEREPNTNTARVDPERPDFNTFPDFQQARGWECVLQAGEILYIPPRWWHHVRSLATSFSVSFWWE